MAFGGADWWSRIAPLLGECVFAIGGLQDTHSLYRRGTDFKTVLRNAQAFIRAGGTATWAFVIFKHNEHQVEEARRLSREMGFLSFRLKKTKRFFEAGKLLQKTKVCDKEGNVEYFLGPPGERGASEPRIRAGKNRNQGNPRLGRISQNHAHSLQIDATQKNLCQCRGACAALLLDGRLI